MSTHGEIEERFEAIRAHGYPFPVVRAILRAHEIPTAQGWDSQAAKLAALAKNEAKQTRALLRRVHQQVTLYSEKAFKLFEVPKRNAQSLIRMLDTASFSNAFSARFPFDLTDAQLSASEKRLNASAYINRRDRSEIVEDEPMFFDSESFESEDIPTLVFSGKRYRTSRDEIEISSMASIPESLAGFDYVIAIRRQIFQFNHCIAVHNFGDRWFIEIRLDHARPWLSGELEKHFLFVQEHINRLYKRKYGPDRPLLTSAINLFPSIDALYRSPDGTVRQAGSVASSASVRDEKMRRSGLDLRKDSFHSHGVQATGFDGFSVQKTWNSDVYETTPSITLPGSVAKASTKAPHLDHGLVLGAACQSDYLLVMRHLFETI